jgi:putative lipoic acid-binding regulatory protein
VEIIKDKTLELDFPCHWQYKLVGKNGDELAKSVKNIMCEKDFTLTPSRSSLNGKFVSLNLDVTINSHEERLLLHDALNKEPVILYVL